jgi:hypothetical protein
MPMLESLVVQLTLTAADCVRGESVRFTATVMNAGRGVVSQTPAIDPIFDPPALILTAAPAGVTYDPKDQTRPRPSQVRRGSARSLLERDGVHQHNPDSSGRVDLAPGQKLTAEGDLLAWFGELPPGRYTLRAEYTGDLSIVVSEPVQLTVRPAQPAAIGAAYPGLAIPTTPYTGFWLNTEGNAKAAMLELRSPIQPGNVLRCVRTGPAIGRTVAAAMSAPDIPLAHLLGVEGRKLRLFGVPVTGSDPIKAAEASLPFSGRVLDSPLSMRDGSVCVVVASDDGSRVAVVRYRADGQVAAGPIPIDLGAVTPVGPASCAWQHGERLHLAWAAPGGRAVGIATLNLDEPAAAPVTRPPIAVDDKILWIGMYLDAMGALAVPPMFRPGEQEEPPPALELPDPLPRFWIACERRGGLALAHYDASAGQRRSLATLRVPPGLPAIDRWSVVSASLAADFHPVLLLTDDTGRLVLASTTQDVLTPLSDRVKPTPDAKSSPVLLGAGPDALVPWVILRAIDTQRTRLESFVVEPPGMPVPGPHEGH